MVLQAAGDLFFEQGYHSTTVDQVIERSGISKPTVYNYYPTKQDLCIAYLTERMAVELKLLRDVLAAKRSAKTKYMGIIEHYGDRILASDYRGCGFYNMISEMADCKNPIVKTAKNYAESVKEIIRAVVEELIQADPKYRKLDKELLTNSYYVILGGMIMASQEFHDVWPIQTARQTISRLIEC